MQPNTITHTNNKAKKMLKWSEDKSLTVSEMSNQSPDHRTSVKTTEDSSSQTLAPQYD